jgi:hypothetical protein
VGIKRIFVDRFWCEILAVNDECLLPGMQKLALNKIGLKNAKKLLSFRRLFIFWDYFVIKNRCLPVIAFSKVQINNNCLLLEGYFFVKNQIFTCSRILKSSNFNKQFLTSK